MNKNQLITVKGISDLCNVTTDTVRHYIDLDILKPERNPKNNYQVFSDLDVARVKLIKLLRGLGLSIDDLAPIVTKTHLNNVNDLKKDSLMLYIQDTITERKKEVNKKIENARLTLNLVYGDAVEHKKINGGTIEQLSKSIIVLVEDIVLNNK